MHALSSRQVGIDALKGIAIFAVIGLHLHSALPGTIYTTNPFRIGHIGFNQLARVSVPIFVAVSGYLLSLKYRTTAFSFKSFLTKRVLTLLPLYLFWSVWIFLTLRLIPEWATSANPLNIRNLILGGMDYHLYFVPMLLTMYLIFPLIYLFHKHSVGLLIASFVIQTLWYLAIPYLSIPDQIQYLIPVTWIFYFVLGFFLARIELSKLNTLWLTLITTIALGIAWSNAVIAQSAGQDIIVASRFTRLSILAYASLFITLSLKHAASPTLVSNRLVGFLAWAGKHSYVIYLSHTLWLRLLIPFKISLSLTSFLIAGLMILGGTLVSYLSNKK